MSKTSNPKPRSECVFSNVLELFGDKWTLLVIRDLFFFNKHEFKEFLSSPESIATNILTDRLKRLLANGVIAEQVHPENKSRKLYFLTEKGKALLPILLSMAKWGAAYMPELAAMENLYRRLQEDEDKLLSDVTASITEWERQNI